MERTVVTSLAVHHIVPARGTYHRGMVLLVNFQHPKLTRDPKTLRTYTEKSGEYTLYVNQLRPVMVVSKQDDSQGNIMVVPLTSRPREEYLEIFDWQAAGMNQKSYAKVGNTVSMNIRDVDRLIGYASEIDISRVMVRVYDLF